MRKYNMKFMDNRPSKISQVIVFLILLSACGGFNESQPAELDSMQTQTAPAEQIAEWPENSDGFDKGQQLRFERISLEHGLSQSHVLSMLQDSRGFMWFGTEDGLNKYNGYTFTVYKFDPERPTSLSDNWITAMLEDDAGVLWIGTRNGGLNAYDRNLDQFTRYQNNQENPHSLSDNEVTAIYQDREGALWVGTKGGLNKFDPVEASFVHYQHNPDDPNSLSSNVLTEIYEDQNGILWVGTEDNGLNRFDRKTEYWRRYVHDTMDPNSISQNNISAIAEDQAGNLWVGTGGRGLNKLVLDDPEGIGPDNQGFIHYQHDPDDRESLGNDEIKAIYPDVDGTLWVGTHGDGLNRFFPETETFSRYRNDTGDPHSISNDFVSAIYQDLEGVLWVGTEAGGLNKLNLGRWNFAHFQHQLDNPNSLSNNVVRALLQDQKGALWVGTLFGGLNRFDPQTKEWHHYNHSPDNPGSLITDWVSDIYEDRSGVIWIGTDGGLERYNPETDTFTHYQAEPGAPPRTPSNDVITMIQEEDGAFWIGTIGGLYQFDQEEESWSQPFPAKPGETTSPDNSLIWTIQEDREGVLWIGTLGSGLFRLDTKKDTITHYRHDPDNPNSLSSDIVGIILQDEEGILWISTQIGLNRFDPETEVFTHYTVKDGMPNDVVYCVMVDAQGYYWLSTNIGLSRFDPKGKTFKNYDESDGLQSNEFNGEACYGSDTGEMFFGGINGFNSFFPDQVIDNPYIPPVVITSLTLNNEDFDLAREGNQYHEIALDWPIDSIEFEYAALSFANPEKNQYAYYLEGFEDTWKEVGSRRFGEYTNLPGGQYTLRVKGSNDDGIWNEDGASVQITVVPPFWQTSWFYIILAALVFGLGFGGYRLRVRSLEARGRELETQVEQRTSELMQAQAELKQTEMEKAISEERNRLARDLHDSVTQSIYSLTLLSEAGQRMITSGDLVQAEDNQTRLSEIAQQALQEMRLLVYELRPQILQSAGLVGALEHRLAAVERRAGITARMHVAQDIDLPSNFEEELFHISMEALNNILKHAGASEVQLSLSIEKDTLLLRVADNGRGFEPELVKNQGGIGISSMIERAEKIGGSLSIQSEPNKGTAVIVNVPLSGSRASTTNDREERNDQ